MDEKTSGPAAQAGCFVCTTVMPILDKMWSTATNDHFRNARVEFLKGIRSLLDYQIRYLTRPEVKSGSRVVVE